MRASRFSVLLVAAAAVAFAQASPKQGQPAAFSAQTNLVLVPVVVAEHGEPVSNLSRQDFQVQENGKSQKIASFEEVTAQAVPVRRAQAASNSFSNHVNDLAPVKLEIIAFDLLNTSFDDRVRARRGMLDFLAKAVDKQSLVAVVTMSQSGVRVLHDFTGDTAVLMDTIRKIQGELSVADTRTASVDREGTLLASFFERDSSRAQTSTDPEHETLSGENLLTSFAVNAQAAQARVDIGRQNDAALATLLNFQEVAQAFSAVQGRKALIWVSTGFPASFANVTGAASRGPTLDDWQRTMQLLQDANFSIYPVDVSGLVPNVAAAFRNYVPPVSQSPLSLGSVPEKSRSLEAVAAGVYSDPVVAKHAAMLKMAAMTGGEAYFNRNDVDRLMARADQDAAKFYLLGYYSTDSKTFGWRKISVSVRRKTAQVRYREGYYFIPLLRDAQLTQQLDEHIALRSALPFTGLPLSGAWGETEREQDVRKVHFSLSIAPGTVGTSDGDHLNMDIFAVVRNQGGQEVATVGQRVNRTVGSEGVLKIENGGITYLNAIRVPPGQYRAQFVVRDNFTGRIGSVSAPLDVQ